VIQGEQLWQDLFRILSPFAVKAIINNDTVHGVSAASSKSYLVDNWLKDISSLAQEFDIIDHLT